MPRRKNQSPNGPILGRDSTENMSPNSDVQKKWRDTTLGELKSMFSGSIDPEVVQLVLSESNYNVNDAVEKLFVLSGIEQGETGSKASQSSNQFPSPVSKPLDSMSTKSPKPNQHNKTSSPDQSGFVFGSRFPESRSQNPAVTSNPSTSGNLLDSSCNYAVTSKVEIDPQVDCNLTGLQYRADIPRTMPPVVLPSGPFNGVIPPDDSTSPVLSSGIPDFPDNVSQQYKTLKNKTKGSSYDERLFFQDPTGHRNLLYNTNARPPVVHKVPGHFELGRPPDVTMGNANPELRGNLESFLNKMMLETASAEKWKTVSHDSNSNTEKQQEDGELSKKGSQNQYISVTHDSYLKKQLPHDESRRTSNSDATNQTNSQNLTFSSALQKVQETAPHHNVKKPHLQQKANTTHQIPYQNKFHASPKDLMFQSPPPVQRQIQPFVPPQGFSRTLPRNTPHQRFAVIPNAQSPWQQRSMIQRPMTAGHMPYQHPQGAFAFQPQYPFGRVPTAAVRPAYGSTIPFIPTIHQKLLILVRGLPGSGKSSLAQRLKGIHGVVLSTDDYFYRNQRYDFDVSLLGEAHEWNQRRAKSALEKLQSPVIIDNTNTQAWEMKPYVSMALKYGYHIKFVEPDTTWKWNVKELARRNQHGVSIEAIIRMKERFEHNMTVEKIVNSERKLDAAKTGNETVSKKGTGTDNQKPRHQSLSKESPQELGMRGTENCEEKTTSKLEVSEKISSLQVVEDQSSSQANEKQFDKLRNSSEKCANVDGKSVSDSKTGDRDENCVHSAVSELDNGKLEEGADRSVTEECDVNSTPKPQRVQKIRNRRTPNRQQHIGTEQSELDSEHESQGNSPSCDNRNKLDVHEVPSQENAPKEESPVYLVETLSKLASLANSCTFSPVASSGGSLTDSPAVTESADVSKPSISLLSDNPLTDCQPIIDSVKSAVLNASTLESDGDADGKRDSSKEPIKEKITCDVEIPNRMTSLPLTLEDDITDADSESDVLRHGEPPGSNSIPTPPPLSAILASASRTKLKRHARSNSDPTQPVTDSENSPEGITLKLLEEPNQAGRELEPNESLQSVSHDNSGQKNYTSNEDVSTDAQSPQSNLSDVSASSSGDSQIDMSAQLEFLKTCFPDVDSDLMNALLTSNSGDVMKVVDELLASGSVGENAEDPEVAEESASSSELPNSPNSPPLVAHSTPFNASNEEEKSPLPEEMGEVTYPTGGCNHQSTDSREHGEISSDTPPQKNRASRPRDIELSPLAQLQSSSQSSTATFQLTLEPAVALHLIELFGSFAGVDFQEDISHEDLIIDVDNSFARQLYKKWEKSIQMKKGISAVKKGSSERAKLKPTGNDSIQFSRDQRSPQRPRNEPQAGTLREIMDEQLALELSRNVPDANEQDIATKLKRQKLYEMFPGIDPVALEEVFQANRYELAPSVEAVKASCNLHSREIPNIVMASGFSGRAVTQEEATRKEAEEDWSWLYLDDSSGPRSDEASFQTLEEPSYLDYRAEAFQHCKQRDECFKKAALAFSKKQGQLAQFYAQQGHLHTKKIKEANARAAALILDQKNESTDDNTIDLHGLHVTEAIEALERMLTERTDPHGGQSRRGCKSISVVTGRGSHSRGGKARIKPAILEYLKKHNYRFMEPHPGLVKVYL